MNEVEEFHLSLFSQLLNWTTMSDRAKLSHREARVWAQWKLQGINHIKLDECWRVSHCVLFSHWAFMNERLVMMEGKKLHFISFHSVEKLTGNFHNPSTLGDGNHTAQNQLRRGTSGHLIVAHSYPWCGPSHIFSYRLIFEQILETCSQSHWCSCARWLMVHFSTEFGTLEQIIFSNTQTHSSRKKDPH